MLLPLGVAWQGSIWCGDDTGALIVMTLLFNFFKVYLQSKKFPSEGIFQKNPQCRISSIILSRGFFGGVCFLFYMEA